MATLDQAIIQIESNGAPLPDGRLKLDGKFHRYGPKSKYWYKVHEFVTKTGQQLISGSFGYWQGDEENTQHIAMDWTDVTDEDRATAEAKRQQIELAEAAKKAQAATNAANRAVQQWRQASAEGQSPYVERKQITAPSVRYQPDGTMLVPAVVLEPGAPTRIVGLQKIAPDGDKRFNAGMAMKGACCPIGRVNDGDAILFIAEGYATARTIAMATNGAIGGFVAFNAGNIMAVAQMARQLHPDTHILICADDDYQLEARAAKWMADKWKIDGQLVIDGKEHVMQAADGEKVRVLATWQNDARGVRYIAVDSRAGRRVQTSTFSNAGVARATEAARAVGNASISCPRFAARGENKWSDFNDLHVNESLVAVEEQLAVALMAGLGQSSTDDEDAVAAVAPAAAAPVAPKAKPRRAKSAAAGGGEDGPPDWPGNGEGVPAGDDDDKWEWRLNRSEKGNILPTLSNVYLVLENHPQWKGVIAYDEFSGIEQKVKLPPFPNAEVGPWVDKDDLRCTLWLQQKYGFAPRQEVVMGAVILVADLNRYHVVRDYLDALAWDGKDRLQRWLIDYLGAEDTPYNRAVARKWLIAAVARIYRPGCKADNVLILEGEQGLNKSTALKVLGGEWFTDAPFRLGDKDSYIVIQGKWIVELAELDSFNKAESTGAKLFFGQYIDRFRAPYGKRAIDVPRQQLFAGTTNSDSYLKDDTGNRRYWPVKALKIDLEALRADRDQIWAEAVAAFRDGAEWWPTSAEKEMFEEQQDERYVGDAYTSLIRNWLAGRSQTTMTEILGECLKLDTAKWTKPEQQRVGRCLSEIGWKRQRSSKTVEGKREWLYKRPESAGGAPAAGGDDEPF
jgi:predicted P-loop ATPase/phage/plasmid primase-like uncharacterized protein